MKPYPLGHPLAATLFKGPNMPEAAPLQTNMAGDASGDAAAAARRKAAKRIQGQGSLLMGMGSGLSGDGSSGSGNGKATLLSGVSA